MLEPEIEKAAENVASIHSYFRIEEARKNQSAMIDVTRLIASVINENYSLSREDFEKISRKVKGDVKINESIDIDEFFSGELK